MNAYEGLRLGLGGLPVHTGARTRSISPENPDGRKGGGARAVPDPDTNPFASFSEHLGQGWKVHPFVKAPAGATVTLCDISGPGVIQHIWIATDPGFGRQLVLRCYWDDEETPSVEAPLGDFFACGHGLFAPVNSLPVVANAAYGLNSYWPMPFSRRARITVENDGETEPSLLTYQITYAETEISEDLLRFHAQWRRSVTDPQAPDHTILDGVAGRGHYVGTFLAWTALSSGWFGEGEIKFFIDGDEEFPTICGTGTEDYFGAAWCFPENYSTPFLGCTMRYPAQGAPAPSPESVAGGPDYSGPQKWNLYRWHVQDPVCFQDDLRVSIQALGWYPTRRYRPLADDIASVAYWYQSEPHTAFEAFPGMKDRFPR